MLAHGELHQGHADDRPPRQPPVADRGGNDTTRNTMSGSVYGLNTFPDQYDKLIADPGLVPKMVPEIRWQTPLSYMRRTATCDTELGGKQILQGDQVLMWYVSANRDEAVFDNADAIDIERPNADRHLSFGYGIHYRMGSRLAELQLRVLWRRSCPGSSASRSRTSPAGRPSFVHGYTDLPVTVTRR
ncbi:MAG: cytochrome P450 [Acidimicrobiales bacterium]